MRYDSFKRPLGIAAVVALTVAAILGFSAFDPLVSREADAQTEAIDPPTVDAPPVAADDGTLAVDGDQAGAESSLTAATPVVPADPTGAAAKGGLVDTGNGLTTSLGGSDVAVSSVGGSYEVDGPKRRSKHRPPAHRP